MPTPVRVGAVADSQAVAVLRCCGGDSRAFRWHDLRHTWASWDVQNGTPLQELMELGSWPSYEMVLRYDHLAADHLQGAACRIDATFSLQTKNPQQVRAA